MKNEVSDLSSRGPVRTTRTREPQISIIMGTYNCLETIRPAIDSILSQTFQDWELVICDDGSDDGTQNILLEYQRHHPTKFIILQNASNQKLARALNRCLEACRGDLVARMDGDDISDPSRLQLQLKYLEDNPTVDLVGTAMKRFDKSGGGDIVTSDPTPDITTLRFGTPFNHATILTYRRIYAELGGYSQLKRADRCEDIDLWFRFFAHGFVGRNLTEPLYYVREDDHAIRRRTIHSRIKLFRTRIAGYEMLGFPVHWYVYPAIELSKAFVPHHVMGAYRRWQKSHCSRTRNDTHRNSGRHHREQREVRPR